MRPTLRRSCNACARSKLSCDLRKPKCSRCIKRRIGSCVYANEPLTLSSTEPNAIEDSNSGSALPPASELLQPSPPRPLRLGFSQALDPFDSYPRTRLPRARVQHLIQHCESIVSVCPSVRSCARLVRILNPEEATKSMLLPLSHGWVDLRRVCPLTGRCALFTPPVAAGIAPTPAPRKLRGTADII